MYGNYSSLNSPQSPPSWTASIGWKEKTRIWRIRSESWHLDVTTLWLWMPACLFHCLFMKEALQTVNAHRLEVWRIYLLQMMCRFGFESIALKLCTIACMPDKCFKTYSIFFTFLEKNTKGTYIFLSYPKARPMSTSACASRKQSQNFV